MIPEFREFQKIPRLNRECIITEKIDGTNACICITEDGRFLTGSRTRWITPENDNFGFSRWAHEREYELRKLGVGTHYGEWWGAGIQRKYGLDHKRFSLFNVERWKDETVRPECCHLVPVLWRGIFNTVIVGGILRDLATNGSLAAPGFMKPEGVIVYHVAGNLLFKRTIEKDEEPKGKRL